MNHPDRLLARLDAISQSLERSGCALALIGLGSVGRERERLDAYSDLDFFAIVEEGAKSRFIDDLDWLGDIAPVAYAFRNTADGYKLLYADGIFCEFAVFTPSELPHIPFAPGRVIWKRASVDESIATPTYSAAPRPEQPDEWLVGEALTNLLVGLGRYRRGEKLIAQRFVQHYAVDRIIELAARRGDPADQGERDPFTIERRVEQWLPDLAPHLPHFIQGYNRTPESALAILAFLEEHAPVNAALARAIKGLAR